jgi:hypothetical protein
MYQIVPKCIARSLARAGWARTCSIQGNVAPVMKTGNSAPYYNLSPAGSGRRAPVVTVLGKICTKYGLTVGTDCCTGYQPSIRSVACGSELDPHALAVLPICPDRGRSGHDLTVHISPRLAYCGDRTSDLWHSQSDSRASRSTTTMLR